MIECIQIEGGIGSLVCTSLLVLMSTTGIASGMRDEHDHCEMAPGLPKAFGHSLLHGFRATPQGVLPGNNQKDPYLCNGVCIFSPI